jgi:hypothetical protein
VVYVWNSLTPPESPGAPNGTLRNFQTKQHTTFESACQGLSNSAVPAPLSQCVTMFVPARTIMRHGKTIRVVSASGTERKYKKKEYRHLTTLHRTGSSFIIRLIFSSASSASSTSFQFLLYNSAQLGRSDPSTFNMKYILLASLLTSAAYAAPFAQRQGGNQGANSNTGASTTGGQGQGQQTQNQAGQIQNQGGNQQQQQQGTQTGAQNGAQSGAAAVNTPTGLGAGIQNGQTPSANDLATAVSNWMADTSMVSNFLNTGASIQNNVQFKQAATVAFNAEVDELNHKAIIDAANGNQPGVIAANSTLATGGSFQDVVDKLQQMSVQGIAAVSNIDLINQNRCVNVLPNIDAYMASTGSTSQAVRPSVCDQTGVAGGVQGAGATQPGQQPGSPAAAFAAAQALVQGTGNGQVQNGNAAAGNAGTAAGAGTSANNPQQAAGITPTNGLAPQGTTGVKAPPQQGTTGTTGAQHGQQAGNQQQQAGAASPSAGSNSASQQQGASGASSQQQAGGANGASSATGAASGQSSASQDQSSKGGAASGAASGGRGGRNGGNRNKNN